MIEGVEYLPATGDRLGGIRRINIGDEVLVGDESSLIPENLAPLAKEPFRIDPEPLPYIQRFHPE